MAFVNEFSARCELEGGLAVVRGPFDTYEDAAAEAEADEVALDENGDPVGDPVEVLAYTILKRAVRA